MGPDRKGPNKAPCFNHGSTNCSGMGDQQIDPSLTGTVLTYVESNEGTPLAVE